MRDNNFTDKQRRGLDLVFKAAKKKFPFVVGWELTDDYEKYDCTLYINIRIDSDKLAEYVGMELKDYKVQKSASMLSQYDWGSYNTDEWEENAEKSYRLSIKIRDFLNENYKMLPDDYKINYNLGHPNLYLVNLSIDYFLFN